MHGSSYYYITISYYIAVVGGHRRFKLIEVTVFFNPTFMTIILVCILHWERSNGRAISMAPPLQRTNSWSKNATYRKQMAELKGATTCEFLSVPGKYFSQGGHSPAGVWWCVSCVSVQQKLQRVTFQRTLLEVLSFSCELNSWPFYVSCGANPAVSLTISPFSATFLQTWEVRITPTSSSIMTLVTVGSN